ncbi:MAG: sugar phosphate isomerase/epimerase family protein [Bacteroidales bacterium]
MNAKKEKHPVFRQGLSVAAVLVVTAALLSFTSDAGSGPAAAEKPDSNYGGVQIGTITYSFRSLEGVDAVLEACVKAGISSVELMGTGVEEYLGAPANPVSFRRMGPPPGARPPAAPQEGNQAQAGNQPQAPPQPAPRPRRPELTDEQKAALAKYQEELQAWRHSDGIMDKYKALRKKFNDAGVDIHIYKWTAGESPEELDYSFQVARALGAVGITAELGEENCKNLGAAAERAGMLAIFHNHMQFAQEDFDVDHFLAMSPANRLNFDAGHYFGSTGKDPCEFIEKYHDKIVSIHLKDKTRPDNETEANANQVWGQGEAPVEAVLKLIQENHWPIDCDIELEYEVKPWSNPVREVNICREYCRQALL